MKFKVGDFVKTRDQDKSDRCVIGYTLDGSGYIIEYDTSFTNSLERKYADASFVLGEEDFVPKHLTLPTPAPKPIPPTSIEVLGAELSVTLLPDGRFGVFDTDALTDYTAPQLEAALASLQALLETLRLLNAVVDPA